MSIVNGVTRLREVGYTPLVPDEGTGIEPEPIADPAVADTDVHAGIVNLPTIPAVAHDMRRLAQQTARQIANADSNGRQRR